MAQPHHHHHPHPTSPPNGERDAEPLDPASKALAEALRISFAVLKLVIIAVLALFIAGGFFKVNESERALVLRFGNLHGAGKKAVRQPGLHWRWPYVDEIIRVPAPGTERTLNVNAFWYADPQRPGRAPAPPGPMLQFANDGYSLTASAEIALKPIGHQNAQPTAQTKTFASAAPDYNIVHSQWVIRYSVSQPLDFARQLWDGTDKGWKEVHNLLRDCLADAVIVVSANRSIDWMIWQAPLNFRDQVQKRMRENLARLNVGLQAQLVLKPVVTPRQVKAAFDRAASARSTSQKLLATARGDASEITNKAQADAEIIVTEAEAYRSTLVKAAQADADYLDKLLQTIEQAAQQSTAADDPQAQQKRQQVYDELLAVSVDQLYQEMLRDVLENADEVFVLSATEGGEVQWWPVLSRDASLEKQKQAADADNQ